LTDKVTVNENELARIEKFRDRLFGTLDKTNNRRTTLNKKQILRDIEAFEDEKRTSKRTRKFKESWRACILLNKKRKRLSIIQTSSNNWKLKHKGIKKGLQNDEIKRRLDAEKKANKASLDNFKDFFEDFDRLMSLVLDKLIDITQKKS
jgi:hypothetical protein